MSRNERVLPTCLMLLFLCSCATASQGELRSDPRWSDDDWIEAAKVELSYVRIGLEMYRAESASSAYPPTTAITSHRELMDVLSPFVKISETVEDASWTFVSYVSARPDTFVLRTRAKDTNRTRITVTSVRRGGL